MKKFKVSAIEKAYFYDIIVEAETKESAEEKFHEKYGNGEISPDEFGFEEIKIKKVKEVKRIGLPSKVIDDIRRQINERMLRVRNFVVC